MSSWLGTKQDEEEEGKAKSRGRPIHLQEVRDDKGRQRLHGAFQGGFSAGYFNTVGSKEGWQPKQFKSSRAHKIDDKHESGTRETLNPFDFMDADDIQEFGGQVLGLNEKYDALGTTERELKRKKTLHNVSEKGAFGSQLIQDLVVPLKNDIGLKLIQIMMVKKSLTLNDGQKELKILIDLKAKQNDRYAYGRGYNPLNDAPEFEKEKGKRAADTTKKSSATKKGGFGMGIFEENDLDDEFADIDSSMVFSTTLGDDQGEEEDYDVFQKHKKIKSNNQKNNVPTNAVKPRAQKINGVIEGFTLRPALKKMPKIFLAPIPPPDFKPTPVFLDPAYKSLKKAMIEAERLQLDKQAEVDKDHSIFSFMSLKDKERLDQFIAKANSKPISKLNKTSESAPLEPPPIYTVPVKVAEAALKGFMPFGNDLEKQSRYRKFLQDIVDRSNSDESSNKDLPKLNHDEAFETREFSKAAMIYRPLSNMIASRFTNETGQEGPKETLNAPVKVIRTTGKWKPSKLTCKRFGVLFKDDSDDEKDVPSLAESKQALNPETMKDLIGERDRLLELGEISANIQDVSPNEVLTKEDMMSSFISGDDLVKEEDIVMEEEREVVEKPSMDLFKAIFADSEDEDGAVEKKQDVYVVMDEPHVEIVAEDIPSSSSKQQPELPFSVAPPPKVPPSSVALPNIDVKQEQEDEDDSPESFFRSKPSKSKPKSRVRDEGDEEEEQVPMFKPKFSGVSSTGKVTKKQVVSVVGSRRRNKHARVIVDHEEPADNPIEENQVAKKRPTAEDFM